MKKTLIFSMLLLLGISAFGDECWSDGFRFDGSEITEEAILLKPTDPLAYSSAMTEGEPKSLTITVEDTFDPEKSASVFADYSETAVEGTACWDYTNDEYKDFPTDNTYLLTETISSDLESKSLTRKVTILPESVSLFTMVCIGMFILRKRVKRMLAILAILAIYSFGVNADGIVSDVDCLQMWPFDRSVVINYALNSEKADSTFDVKFYGSINNGETTFELSEYGTITRDGAGGTVEGNGKHKALWTPDESFYETFVDDMKVKVTASERPQPGKDAYMIIDLSGGTNASSFAISYLDEIPEGGWTEEYKTTKLVLKKIEPGTFTMGSPEDEYGRGRLETQHSVTLTKFFYAGVFEVTQKQYELVMGSNPSDYIGSDRPVQNVSYDMIRGNKKGAAWPANNKVDEESFLGILRAKTSKDFDLPTEGQWEYACRAGTTTGLNNGTNITNEWQDGNLNKLGCYSFNSGEEHTSVGSYLPNAWGLYDMHGNIFELCLDWFAREYPGSVVDPKGPEEGSDRICRGGSYANRADGCRSAARGVNSPHNPYFSVGFRLAYTYDEKISGDKYMVVDLSGGTSVTNYPISYLAYAPPGGWPEEYKTTKLVLRLVQPGTFVMGSPENELGRDDSDYIKETQHEVTLTKPFYIGVFPVTQKQYELITGSNPSQLIGDVRPVDCVSYNMIRGSEKGAGWPVNNDVDANTFMGILRSKTNKAFDLPTEAQWEYACRVGTTAALNSGKNLSNETECSEANEVGRYYQNQNDGQGGYEDGHTTVGSYIPNAWGLYDMHGNIYEWCLDWYQVDLGSVPATDPVGPTTGAFQSRSLRGGGWASGMASYIRSAARDRAKPQTAYWFHGLRIALLCTAAMASNDPPVLVIAH